MKHYFVTNKHFYLQGAPKTYAPFKRLLWRSHKSNLSVFESLSRRDIKLEFGTKFDTAFTLTQLNQLYLNQFKFQPIK